MRPTVVYVAVAILVSGSVLVPTVGARAQSAPTLQSIPSGTRVRITAPSALTPRRQAGQLVALRPDTLVLQPDGNVAPLALPLTAVTGVEVSRRRHRSTVAGLLIGVIAGGAAGAAIGAASYRTPKATGCPDGMLICGPFDMLGRGGAATLGGLLGVVTGSVLGAFVGHAHQSDSWENVPLGLHASLSF